MFTLVQPYVLVSPVSSLPSFKNLWIKTQQSPPVALGSNLDISNPLEDQILALESQIASLLTTQTQMLVETEWLSLNTPQSRGSKPSPLPMQASDSWGIQGNPRVFFGTGGTPPIP